MTTYKHRPVIRFFEADQQRVVYHMWYLAYFEDARNAMLIAAGMSLRSIQGTGLDLQIVHYNLDWHGPVRWDDALIIGVDVTDVGTSSFRVTYEALVDGGRQVRGEAVYVVVSIESGQSQPVPDALRTVLTMDAEA